MDGWRDGCFLSGKLDLEQIRDPLAAILQWPQGILGT